MNTQERAVMEQALDALEYKGYGSKARTLRQALAEPARTLADPVTDDEIVSPPKEQAMSKNTDLARECGMNAIRGGGWWFETDAQLDAFAESVLIAQMKSGAPEAPAAAELGKAVQP